MKLYIDTAGKQFQVSRDVEEKKDQNGQQRSEKGTGRLMWSTQVIALDEDWAEVITITTAGVKPDVRVGTIVAPVRLEAIAWATNGKNGVAYKSEELKPVSVASAK